MKWIAAILMVANVLIFLGISDRQVEYVADQQELSPDVNGDSMLLLKEVYPENAELAQSDLLLGASDGVVAPVIATGEDLPETIVSDDSIASLEVDEQGLTQRIDEAEPEEQSDTLIAALVPAEITEGPANLLCYRIGPFKNKSLWNRATGWVESQKISMNPISSESRELRAVRVYVGPFDSIAAAQTDVEVLKQKELDYFVYLRDDNQARISLGYFTQEELSIKFVDYLRTQNIEAKSQPEYRTLGPYDWMDIEIDSSARSVIRDRDWGDKEIEVIERDCE
ncbi:MAG: hypothetical protein KTR18_12210 [Acidiferrobacterales bacterium]|nr:hypothetical protein [Acidiferrobacterales bacterium]